MLWRPLYFILLSASFTVPGRQLGYYHPGAMLKPQCQPLSGRWKG